MKIIDRIYPLTVFPLFAFPLFKEDVTMKFFILFALFTILNFYFNKEKFTNFKSWTFHFIPFLIVSITCLFHFSQTDNLKEISLIHRQTK